MGEGSYHHIPLLSLLDSTAHPPPALEMSVRQTIQSLMQLLCQPQAPPALVPSRCLPLSTSVLTLTPPPTASWGFEWVSEVGKNMAFWQASGTEGCLLQPPRISSGAWRRLLLVRAAECARQMWRGGGGRSHSTFSSPSSTADWRNGVLLPSQLRIVFSNQDRQHWGGEEMGQ